MNPSRPSVGPTVAFAAAAMSVSYLPFSAVFGVLGAIGVSAGVGTGQLQWVTDAFTVALTAAVLSGGTLSQRYGGRRMSVVGLTLTVLACAVGFLAGGLSGPSVVHLLWVGQAVAGLGGGVVMSATLTLVAATAPSPRARTRSIAVWASANVVGLGAGPFLSGAVSDAGTAAWRWMFPMVAVLAASTVAFGVRWAAEAAGSVAGRVDCAGQSLGTLGVVALVFAIIRGGDAGWADPGTLAGLLVGAALVVAFLLVERRRRAPAVRPALFASRGFDAAAVAAATALLTIVGLVFILSLYLAGQQVHGLGIAQRLGCLFAGNAVASLAAGPLQNRFGSRAVLLAGQLVGLAGLVTLLGARGPGLADLGWRLLLVGAGCGVVVASSTAVAVQSVPAPLIGMAATVNTVIRQLGAALGPAVAGAVLAAHAGPSLLAARASIAALLCGLALATLATAVLLVRLPVTQDIEGVSMIERIVHLPAVEGVGPVDVTVSQRGEGRPVLVLHGGGGPATVAAWADQLAAAGPALVLTPVHPGFNGTARPTELTSIQALARVYFDLLVKQNLHDVTVVGNSLGGWVAAEMAVLGSDRVAGYVLVDAVGIEVPGHPVVDFFSLTPAQVAQHSYHDPDRYGVDPAKLPAQAREAMAGNRQTLAVYGGRDMTDPTLAPRLASVRTPTLVVWGEADRIADPDFGRAYANAIPGGRFHLLERTGHLPQIETPQALIDVVWNFATARR